jgi:hypothetical protein
MCGVYTYSSGSCDGEKEGEGGEEGFTYWQPE